jgi:uncharacterized membrane protein
MPIGKDLLAMPLPVLHLITAIATAVMAGFFWSFSVVVMEGLRLLPPLEGMRAMQAINAVVRNPLFGIGFFGTPILCTLVLLSLLLPGGRRSVVLSPRRAPPSTSSSRSWSHLRGTFP